MFGLGTVAAVAATAIGVTTNRASAYALDKDIVETQLPPVSSRRWLRNSLCRFRRYSEGPDLFIVFAPTDTAFAKLPAGTVDTLHKPQSKVRLMTILPYHVVAGKLIAADVVKLKESKIANGAMVTVKVDGSNMMINNAKITTADIEA